MTRQLLEDIRHELIANLSEEKVRVFGLAVDVVKSYSDDDAKEYTFDVKYKGKDICLPDCPTPIVFITQKCALNA